MKKFAALLLAAMMVFSCAAFAEEAPAIEYDRTSPVTDWAGEWVLANAYVGAEYADDLGLEVSGLIEVPADAMTMTVSALLDGSATGSDAGVMVDQAQYLHAHVYDMEAQVTFSADLCDEPATLRLPWDGWLYTVRGENDGDFNMGVGKLSKVTCEDKTLFFTKLTGIESEDIDDEKMTYVGMTTAGQLFVCYSDTNIVKKEGEISFGYLFNRVVAE